MPIYVSKMKAKFLRLIQQYFTCLRVDSVCATCSCTSTQPAESPLSHFQSTHNAPQLLSTHPKLPTKKPSYLEVYMNEPLCIYGSLSGFNLANVCRYFVKHTSHSYSPYTQFRIRWNGEDPGPPHLPTLELSMKTKMGILCI